MTYKVGEKVNWYYSLPGGYGYTIPVAAVIEKIGKKKIKIRVAHKVDGKWKKEYKWVVPDKLERRMVHVPEVD